MVAGAELSRFAAQAADSAAPPRDAGAPGGQARRRASASPSTRRPFPSTVQQIRQCTRTRCSRDVGRLVVAIRLAHAVVPPRDGLSVGSDSPTLVRAGMMIDA